jgi:DNA-binding NtrC family response regulator
MDFPENLKGKTILVVDDEEMLREAIVFDLRRRGCETLEAGDGKEAFEIVSKHKVDAVISDVRMPKGGGVELLERIRAAYPYWPVVLLVTGFADITEPEAIRKGAIGLLDKPIDRKKMLQALSDALSASERDGDRGHDQQKRDQMAR